MPRQRTPRQEISQALASDICKLEGGKSQIHKSDMATALSLLIERFAQETLNVGHSTTMQLLTTLANERVAILRSVAQRDQRVQGK
jgi:hypothetical protein